MGSREPSDRLEEPRRLSSRRLLKAGLLGLAKVVPVPSVLFDLYVWYKLGSSGPEVPQVLFVRRPGADGELMALKDLPPPAAGTRRLVVVSDTHERHRQVVLPEGDVLLHCGDILMSSSLAATSRGLGILEDFNLWLGTAPCKERVVIGGNHDVILESLGDAGAQELLSNAIFVQDASVVLPLAGIKVYGNAFSVGDSHNVAWQGERPDVSDECVGADVVMTHLAEPSIVEEVLRRTKPLLWVSGHAHADYGVTQNDGITFVNAAIMDMEYQPVQAPVVVDLPPSQMPVN